MSSTTSSSVSAGVRRASRKWTSISLHSHLHQLVPAGVTSISTRPEADSGSIPSTRRPTNPDLKWETTTTWNVGLDLGFLNNRITIAADWYKRITTDLLAFVPTGASNTANMMWRNIGSMDNMGVEVTIGAKPVVTDNFTWSTSFNVAWNKNKITELQGDGETSRTQAIGLPSGKGGAGLAWHIVGQPAHTFMVYEQVYAENGDPIEDQYVDQNADGVINEDDLIMYHSRDPKVTMAWNNTFTWKNWDLGISLRANLGNYVYNQLKQANTRVYDTTGAPVHALQPDGGHLPLLQLIVGRAPSALELLCGERKLPPLRQHHPGIHHSRLPFAAPTSVCAYSQPSRIPVITKFTGLSTPRNSAACRVRPTSPHHNHTRHRTHILIPA